MHSLLSSGPNILLALCFSPSRAFLQCLALVFVGAVLATAVAASDPQLRGIVNGNAQGKGTTFMDRLRRHRPTLPSLRDYEVGLLPARHWQAAAAVVWSLWGTGASFSVPGNIGALLCIVLLVQ